MKKVRQNATIANEETVSVILARKIKPGFEQDFWRIDEKLVSALEQFSGFLSVNHFPTTTKNVDDADGEEYITIVQFSDVESLLVWEQSQERAKLIEQSAELVVGGIRRKSISGLEGMFEPPLPTSPPRYKMALMIIAVIFSLLLLLKPIISSLVPELPIIFQSLLLVIIQVVAMTYFIMPRLTRLLSRWLYR